MGDPRLNAPGYISPLPLASRGLELHAGKATLKTADIPLSQFSAIVREADEADEIDSVRGREEAVFVWMDREAQIGDFFVDELPLILRRSAIFAEEEKIIDVADVAAHADFVFHEMVERIQVDVCEELACEIPDR